MAKINFVDLSRLHQKIRPEINRALKGVVDNSAFMGGPELEKFEKAFARYCGVKFAIGVDCGYTALELGLRGLGVVPGDEVITPANSFIASSLPISYIGAKPVLVDCQPETYNLDPSLIEKAVTKKTKAIMPVHLYGQPAVMAEIKRIAGKHGLSVIEDACQAHGAKYQGQKAGSLGDVAAFSFYPSKNLGAFGNGGVITTNKKRIADKLRDLVNYGQTKKYHHRYLSWDRRLDALQTAVLRVKLPHLDQWNRQRRQAAHLYTRLLSKIKGVETPFEEKDGTHVYHLYVIRVKNRDRLQKFLAEREIYTGIHYPIPIHLQKAYRYLGYKKGDFPVTEKLSQEILSLPMFPGLKVSEINHVVDSIKKFLKTEI